MAVLQILLAGTAPGASYLLAWPLIAGVAAFSLLMGAPPRIGIGWRLVALCICPALVFIPVAPLLPQLIVALGSSAAALVALAALLMAICVAPQLVLASRRG